MSTFPKPKTVRDPQWLKEVRTRRCWVSLRDFRHICADTIGHNPSEASHLDTKSRDDRTLPMCGLAHRTGRWSWHAGQKTFCKFYGVSKRALIAEAEALYASFKEGK